MIIKNFPTFKQSPDYPTGCESVALYTLLKYYNIDVNIDQIIKKLKKGDKPHYENNVMYGGNPEREFLGNPKEKTGYGVYEKPIEEVANKFKPHIRNITGTNLDEILKIIDKGCPVQVWTSINCKTPKIANHSWIDKQTGKRIIWKQPFHSLVIIGYNKEKIITSDPYYGQIKEYNKVDFEYAYNFFEKRALYYEEKAKTYWQKTIKNIKWIYI